MNILLCVKQVPDTADIRIDPVKNVLIRKGVPSILNPFDSYALEAAARIKRMSRHRGRQRVPCFRPSVWRF